MVKVAYDYIVVGAGISGCTVSHKLNKYSNSILLIDKNNNVASEASGAAGAFLSPLLGKPNNFKTLVNKALKFSTNFYKEYCPDFIDNCGTTRIPKNKEDKLKFQSYKPYIEFEYTKEKDGYFFQDASVVDSYQICKTLTKNIEKLFNYNISKIEYENNLWIINGQYQAKNLILTTGYNVELLDEFYINIRPVWGQRIVIETSTKINHNYHKECSVSRTLKHNDKYITFIGATHHRFISHKDINKNDTQELLQKASGILELKDIKVIEEIAGARAASIDYFPMVGDIIDARKTLKEFPYLKNGTNVNSKRYTRYKNCFILNGVGGRGFVLAPYLANILVEHIINKKPIDKNITIDRLFKRAVKKLRN